MSRSQPGALNQHRDSLEAYFKEDSPRNTAAAQAALKKLTGLKRSPIQVQAFLGTSSLSKKSNSYPFTVYKSGERQVVSTEQAQWRTGQIV